MANDNLRAYCERCQEWYLSDQHACLLDTDEARRQYMAARVFDTGATRDTDVGKLDYEGFLSPRVLRRYAAYMHQKRTMPDGSVRDGDNWQKGMPVEVYMKSLLRHVMSVWEDHRSIGLSLSEEDLCAILFNVQGLLFETIKERQEASL